MQVLPGTDLRQFIKHYLWVESHASDLQKMRLFSDGNTGLAFSFSSGSFQNGSQNHRERKVTLYGQIETCLDFSVDGHFSMLIVVFRPFGLSYLLGIPAHELTGQLILAEDLLGADVLELHEKLEGTPTIGKFELLDQFFRIIMQGKSNDVPENICHAMNLILTARGWGEVDMLSKELDMGARKLERHFRRYIGLPPKPLMRIVRLHQLLGRMRQAQNPNLTVSSYQSGYYDQSHAIREFRKITGMNPGTYLRNTSPLAVNLVVM